MENEGVYTHMDKKWKKGFHGRRGDRFFKEEIKGKRGERVEEEQCLEISHREIIIGIDCG